MNLTNSNQRRISDFDIIPFEFLPSWVRFAYGEFLNDEEGTCIFLTTDEVDDEMIGMGYYGAVFSNGAWSVMESYPDMIDAIAWRS